MDTSTANPTASTSTDIQLPINLFTRNPSHTIPSSTYLLPSSWRRFQLSSLINKVLNPSAPIPFDFIVDGELLRGSLETYIKNRRGGDMESTLNVEYVESLLPPKEQGTFPQDDWVSGVSLRRPGYILLSSYLSHAKIIPLTHPTTTTSSDASPESSSITLPLPTRLGSSCVSWLSPPPSHGSYNSDAPILVGAGGVDRQGHVFSVPSEKMLELQGNDGKDVSEGCKEVLTLHLHTGPISSINPSGDYSHVLTSAWDGLLGVFKLPSPNGETIVEKHDVPSEPTTYLTGQDRRGKKRRLNTAPSSVVDASAGLNPSASNYAGETNGLAPSNSGGWRRAPEIVLRGHGGRIGGSIWDKMEGGRVWSAGWDGSVRGWDVDSGAAEIIKQGPQERAALCIDQMAGSGSLVTGHMDRVVCLWDARESASVVSLTLPTPSATPSVTAHPTSHFTLATASYSGHLQIWDVRSPKQALFSVKKNPRKDNKIVGGGTGERLLSVDWDGEVMIAGGEDGEVGVWSARGE